MIKSSFSLSTSEVLEIFLFNDIFSADIKIEHRLICKVKSISFKLIYFSKPVHLSYIQFTCIFSLKPLKEFVVSGKYSCLFMFSKVNPISCTSNTSFGIPLPYKINKYYRLTKYLFLTDEGNRFRLPF